MTNRHLRAAVLLIGCGFAPIRAEAEPALRVPPVRIEVERSTRPGDRIAADVTVLTRADLDANPGQTLDDVLRRLPGFRLFRRTSSQVAHPTAQGASLRVAGPSGASRALVVVDGVPLNDAFGGWVYWSKLPLESIERIEVLRGSGAPGWGDGALGGVIDIRTRAPADAGVAARAEAGNRSRKRAEFWTGGTRGAAGAALSGRYFDSNGYTPVASGQRGAIDSRAEAEQMALRGRVDYAWTPRARGRVDAQLFREDRTNGTELTDNRTRSGALRGGGEFDLGDCGQLELNVFGERQQFESLFSSQAADRSSESPALDQFDVPSGRLGTRIRWSHTVGAHQLAAGVNTEWRFGATREDFRNLGAGFTRRRKAGGDQLLSGFYAEDVFSPAAGWQLALGGRVDFWRSFDGFRRERDFQTGAQVRDQNFRSRERVLASPRVAVSREWGDHMAVRATFHQGFRVPTLNELYRPFRVRNDITEANPDLDPERLLGGELAWLYADDRGSARITAFWNELEDAIANVTLGEGVGAAIAPCGFVPNGGTCRQRMNLGKTRNRGVEFEFELHPFSHWTVWGSYVFNDAEILRASPGSLEGNSILQTPRHAFALEVQYANPRWFTLTVALRHVGAQFEDDRNTLRLDDYPVVDAVLSRELLPGLEAYLAGENLFDRGYAVGKTADGLETVGTPAGVLVGVRLRLP